MLESAQTLPSRDRFTLHYAVWAGLGGLPLVLGNDLDRMFNLFWYLVPVIGIPLLVTAILLLGSLIRCLWKKRWREAASVVAAPIIAFAFYFGLAKAGVTTDRIRFVWAKQYYVQRAAAVPRIEGAPRLIAFPWSDRGGAGVANIIETLVYDESGEFGLSWGERSAPWHDRALTQCPQCNDSNFDEHKLKLDETFYLVREIYQ